MSSTKLAVGILVALVGSAAAKGVKKPSNAQAVDAATKWAEALEGGEAQPLTADAFTVRVSNDGAESAPCPDATAKEPTAIAKALTCVHEHAPFGRELAAVKSLKKNVPYLARWRKQLTDATKTATLVFHHGQCAGQGDDVAIAVVLDKDDKPKVSAIYYASIFCGE